MISDSTPPTPFSNDGISIEQPPDRHGNGKLQDEPATILLKAGSRPNPLKPQEGEIDAVEVSWFDNAKSYEATPVRIGEVLEGMREENSRELVESVRTSLDDENEFSKRKAAELPAIAWSGLFEGGHDLSNLVRYNNIICVDLDHLEDPEATKEMLKSDPCIFSIFLSPSGRGLKVIVPLKNCPEVTAWNDALANDPEHIRKKLDGYHKAQWEAVRLHFEQKHGLVIDPLCKDITRLCFLSYDPNPYIAERTTPLPLAPVAPDDVVTVSASLSIPPGPMERKGTRASAADQTEPSLSDIELKLEGVAADEYEVWRNVGIALHNHFDGSQSAFEVFVRWSQKSSKYTGEDDCRRLVWDYAVKSNQSGNRLGIGTILYYADEAALPQPVDLRTLTYRPSTDKECLFNDWALARGEVMSINGATGVGKSVFAFQLAAHAAVGLSTCGFRPNGALKVMVIENEDTENTMVRKINGVCHRMPPDQQERAKANLQIFRPRGVAGRKFTEMLEKLVRKHRPDFVIINPVSKYFGGNMIDPKETTDFFNRIEPIADQFQCGIMLVGHFKKQSAKSKEEGLEDAYGGFGSAKWADFSREVMSLKKTTSPNFFELTISKRKSEWGWKRESLFLVQSEDRSLPYWAELTDLRQIIDIQTRSARPTLNEQRVLEVLSDYDHKMTYGQIGKATGLARRTLVEVLKGDGFGREGKPGSPSYFWKRS